MSLVRCLTPSPTLMLEITPEMSRCLIRTAPGGGATEAEGAAALAAVGAASSSGKEAEEAEEAGGAEETDGEEEADGAECQRDFEEF